MRRVLLAASLLSACAAGGGDQGGSDMCGGRACRDGGSGGGTGGGTGGGGSGTGGDRPDAWGSSGGGWSVPDAAPLPDAGLTVFDARPPSYPDAPSTGGAADGGGAVTGCGSETYGGRCEGNTVVWCENSAIQRDTCDTGTFCGYSTTLGYYACIPTSSGGSGGGGCGSVTYEGHCLSTTTVEWCEGGTLKTLACSSSLHCGYNADYGFYACVP